MVRRLATFVVLSIIAGATGLALSAPAYAADTVMCVGTAPAGVTCDQTFTMLKSAVDASNADGVPDTIHVASGHYSDGPYTLNGNDGRATLVGSGQGSTFIELPASATQQNYITAVNAGVQDLTVHMNESSSQGDTGISTSNAASLRAVTVDGANTQNAVGLRMVDTSVTDSSIQMPTAAVSDDAGVISDGGSSMTDSTITATGAYYHSGLAADTLSRLDIKAHFTGISTDGGSVAVDDSLIDLGNASGGVGLSAATTNVGTDPMSITANHVTVVGGTGGGSIGVYASAIVSAVQQHASVQLVNSIVSGPENGLQVEADNDGTPGANSTATITTSYSDWSTSYVAQGPHGTAAINSGAGHLDVDPGFVNAAAGDYRLAATSPVIDQGAPGTGAPALDLSKGTRVLDGNGDGTAVRDLGAYEAPEKPLVTPPGPTPDGTTAPDTTAPDTTLTSHPRKQTTKRRVSFGFTASESPATYQCRIDQSAWAACGSSKTLRVARGWHVFKVRAIDAGHNVDPTPARFRFHRV